MSEEIEIVLTFGDHVYKGKLMRQATSARVTDAPPDLTKSRWKHVIGEHGPFDIAEKDPNNPGFQQLQAYLDCHNGKAQINGFFVWHFTDGSGSIGRKPLQK